MKTIIEIALWTPILFSLIIGLMAWLVVASRRAQRLIAGSNFPPGIPVVGTFETFSVTGLTAALATRTVFIAPVSGLYLVGFCLNITQTNKAGTIAATLTTPHAGTITQAVSPDPAAADPITAIELDPALGGATPVDGFGAMIPVWMNFGDVIQVAAAVAGLTGTTYNVFTVVGRVL
jgi:hypothetical protein